MEIIRTPASRMASLKTKLILGFLILPIVLSAQIDTLRINEFMALNQSNLMDKNGVYSDWIELFNPTAEVVRLKDWSLTDEKKNPEKWIFPDIVIAPGEYLVLFASGKDRSRPNKELHVNFKLSGSGEFLALYDNNGNEISLFDPSFPEQQPDVSYGYLDGTYVGFRIPTPGKENDGSDIIEDISVKEK